MEMFRCDDCGKPFGVKVTGFFCPDCRRKREIDGSVNQKVKHGEWIVCGDGEYVPFMCTACGKTTSWYNAQTSNYCPNCGAKMDGDRNA